MANTPGLNVTSGTVYTLQNEQPANGQKPHFAEKHGALHLVKLSKDGGFQGNLGSKAQFVTDIRSPQNELTLYGHKITLPKLEPVSGAETPNARLIVSFETSEDKRSLRVKIKLDNGGERQKWDLDLNKDSGNIDLGTTAPEEAPKNKTLSAGGYTDSGSAEDYFYLKAQREFATKPKDGSRVGMGFSSKVKQTTTANGVTSSKNLSLDTMHFRQDVDRAKEIVSTYLANLPKTNGKPNEEALKGVIKALDSELDSAVEAHNKGEADDKQKVIVALAKLQHLKNEALNEATKTEDKSSPQFLETAGRLAYILGKGDEFDNMQVLAESFSPQDVAKLITGPLDRGLVNTQLSLPIIAEATLPEEMFIAKQLSVEETDNRQAIKDNMDSALETLLKPKFKDSGALEAAKDIHTRYLFEKVFSSVISDCAEKLGRSDQSEAQSKQILKAAFEERLNLITEGHPDYGVKNAIGRAGDRVINAIVPKLAGLSTKAESTSEDVSFAEGVEPQPEQPQAQRKPQNQDRPADGATQSPVHLDGTNSAHRSRAESSRADAGVKFSDLDSLLTGSSDYKSISEPCAGRMLMKKESELGRLGFEKITMSGDKNRCWMRSSWYTVLEHLGADSKGSERFSEAVKDLGVTHGGIDEIKRMIGDYKKNRVAMSPTPQGICRLGAPGKAQLVEGAMFEITKAIFNSKKAQAIQSNQSDGASYDDMLSRMNNNQHGTHEMCGEIIEHFGVPAVIRSGRIREQGALRFYRPPGLPEPLLKQNSDENTQQLFNGIPAVINGGQDKLGHFDVYRKSDMVGQDIAKMSVLTSQYQTILNENREALQFLELKTHFLGDVVASWDEIQGDSRMQDAAKLGFTKQRAEQLLADYSEALTKTRDAHKKMEALTAAHLNVAALAQSGILPAEKLQSYISKYTPVENPLTRPYPLNQSQSVDPKEIEAYQEKMVKYNDHRQAWRGSEENEGKANRDMVMLRDECVEIGNRLSPISGYGMKVYIDKDERQLALSYN